MLKVAKPYTASTPMNSQFSFLFDSDWSTGITDKLTDPYSCDELKDPGQLYGGPSLSTQRNNILIRLVLLSLFHTLFKKIHFFFRFGCIFLRYFFV